MGSLENQAKLAVTNADVARLVQPHEQTAEQSRVLVDISDGALAVDLSSPRPSPRLLAEPVGLLAATRYQLFMKRAIDIVGAIVGMIVLSPVALAIAIAIKLTSRGPVLYKQTRVGKDAREFTFLKFRSMRMGADCEKEDLSAYNEASGPVFKIKEDPRVTRLGRFLRRSSLDELPQLLHVLTGEMSLVGFRPPLPAEVAQYDDYERQRLLIKPGLTCIWQVSGRSDLPWQTWMEMDLEYIATWTPMLDFKLMLRTFHAVFARRGAY